MKGGAGVVLFCFLNVFISGAVPPPSAEAGRTDTVRVTIIGDVMMHARQLDYDCSTFLLDLRPALEKADIAVANMEFSLGGEPYSGYPAFSAPDSYAQYVSDCGVDVFLLANNHVLDRGMKGLERTLGVYEDGLMPFTGIDLDARSAGDPLIVSCSGLSFAFVNCTYGSNNPAGGRFPRPTPVDEKVLERSFAKAKEQNADFIIALPHWGEEYTLRHNAYQERWAEWMVSMGADAIVGAHPHVVQDTTSIGGVPVIYSVGNAVSNMSARDTRLGLAVTLSFEVNGVTGEKRQLPPMLDFIWCTLPGKLTDGYASIFVRKWLGRREDWKDRSDYDNMAATLSRVKQKTGIK